MQQIVCDNCGTSISVKEIAMKRYDHHFCSRKCYYEYQRKMKNKISNGITQQIKLKKFANIRMEMLFHQIKDVDINELTKELNHTQGIKYKIFLKEYMKRKNVEQ